MLEGGGWVEALQAVLLDERLQLHLHLVGVQATLPGGTSHATTRTSKLTLLAAHLARHTSWLAIRRLLTWHTSLLAIWWLLLAWHATLLSIGLLRARHTALLSVGLLAGLTVHPTLLAIGLLLARHATRLAIRLLLPGHSTLLAIGLLAGPGPSWLLPVWLLPLRVEGCRTTLASLLLLLRR